MKKMLTIVATMSGLLVGAVSATTTQASSVKLASGYLDEMKVFSNGFVTTKKSIKTDLYRKINGKKVRYTIPKGATVGVATTGYTESNGKLKTTVSLNLSNQSYKFRKSFTTFNKKHGYWIKTDNIALKSSTFKLAKSTAKNKYSDLVFERGSAFNYPNRKKATGLFNITDDGYVQYYDSQAVKKSGYEDGLWNQNIYQLKPTATQKISKIRRDGHVTYFYYNHPINGLKEYKVGKSTYRLKINLQNHDGNKTWVTKNDLINANWQNYHVGGKSYYVINNIDSE